MSTVAYYLGAYTDITLNVQVDGVDADPASLSLQMEEPDGTITTLVLSASISPSEIWQTSTGDFAATWRWRQSGRHYWRWVGAGSAAGATEGEAWVRRQNAGA